MKIGWDLDGVLCEINVALLRIIDNLPTEVKDSAEEWYYRERKPLLNPQLFMAKNDEFYILTSRPKRLLYITLPWIEKYYPNAHFVYVDHETLKGNSNKEIGDWLMEMAKKKSEIIKNLKLEVYFEDSPHTVDHLRKLCPDTKIVKYGGRIEL